MTCKSIKKDLCRFEAELILNKLNENKSIGSDAISPLDAKIHIRTVLDSNGQNITDPFKICQILNSHFETVFTKNDAKNGC
ncbi:hypothetical protein BpHYR1_028241 [Brachionus plicatilis]|uniref:Uncharacterized protein n=1 Tax=Brachionus plicatilis TaxID=10195 RepID=A0A3M7R6P3_BRAPC|nr:hypothetical protein BpHYR1_028241 [Brachionus plicatilis]